MECFCDSGVPVHDTNLWDMAEEYNASQLNPTCPCKLMAPRNRSWAQKQLDEHYEMQRELEVERQLMLEAKVKQQKEKEAKESKPGNWYLITLTQPETDKTVKRRLECCKKVLVSKQVKAEQWAYSIELTEKGTPHIHIALFTYAYPEFRVISKFNDGHRVDVTREKMNVKKYIIKSETKPTPENLAEWGMETWFFCSENYSGPRPEDAPAEVQVQATSP